MFYTLHNGMNLIVNELAIRFGLEGTLTNRSIFHFIIKKPSISADHDFLYKFVKE